MSCFFIDDAVVDAVEPAGFGDEILPGGALVAEIGDAVLRFDVFVFEEAQENEAIQRALGEFGERFAVELGIVVFEGAGEFVAEFVQFFEKRVVNGLIGGANQAALDGFAAFFRQGGGEFFERAVGNGFAGEEPVDFREFLRVFVVAEMVFAEVLRQRGVNVRTVAAVQNLELFKIVQDGDGRGTAPAVADGLEIIVGRGDVAVRFLGLDVEFHVAEIRREIKGVVGPTLRKAVFPALDFDLLLEGVLLGLVVHVPAEGEPEFVNEVVARLLFLIGRGQVEFLVGPKIGHKLSNFCKGCIKPGWHGGSECAPEMQWRQFCVW